MFLAKSLRSLILLAVAGFPGLATISAQVPQISTINRDNVVIHEDKPTIYLCVDRERASKVDVWLRIVNNTIWTIKFNAHRTASPVRMLRLTNGSSVYGSITGSTSYPNYQLDSDHGNSELGWMWGDVSTPTWVPTDSYSIFEVPLKKIEKRKLFIEYKYEWELIGPLGQESHGPEHRVYLNLTGSADLTDYYCS